MLNKQKAKTLQYLLVQQQGKLFDHLLNNIQHHSLATLLIELLELQITANPEKKEQRLTFENSDNSDDETRDEAEVELTPLQKQMQETL